MLSRERGVSFWVSAWLPVLISAAVICVESTPTFGTDHTSGPLRAIFEALFGHVSDAIWNDIHHIMRKSGHFIGYGLIGLTWLRAGWMTLLRMRFLVDAALAILGTTLLACWDEWHQSFLPNRTSSPWDVLLDCAGAAAACTVVYVYWRIFTPDRLPRSQLRTHQMTEEVTR
jgi:VanZ family protein